MTIDSECHVEIPADKLTDAVRLAYEYSRPQGLGFLHAQPGPLSDEAVAEIIGKEQPSGRIAASMDYVLGRACKFTVFREGEKLFVRPTWYDHGDWQLEELLTELGIEDAAGKMAAARDAQIAANEKRRRENP